MKLKAEEVVLIFGSILVVMLLFFYYAPIYMRIYANGLDIFCPRFLTLKKATEYYGVLSSFITLMGLFLGFSYYVHKLNVDNKTAEVERKRKRLEYLISEINHYNELVDDLIHYRFADEKELEKLRSKISRSFETTIAMLEHKTKLLGLDDENTKTILKVHSFVEQNKILMHYEYDKLTKKMLLSVKEEYIDLIQDARQLCFEKIC